jgi:NDP-sugar pyrophosphorylase family protein
MSKTKEAVILCGGQTWMLRPETQTPKPLLNLGEKTLIEKQVNWLADHRFEKITLAVSKNLLGYIMLRTDVYKKLKQIKNTQIAMSIEDTELGTGGALKKACQRIQRKTFYACNVDDLAFDYDPCRLLEEADSQIAVLVAKPTLPYGKVKIKNGYIKKFEEKPKLDYFVNAGHYAMEKSTVIKYFPNEGDFEKLVLPRLARQNMLKGVEYHGTWITIDTFNDYLNALSLFGT